MCGKANGADTRGELWARSNGIQLDEYPADWDRFGKGAPEGWVCVVRPGRILFEMEGVDVKTAQEAMRLAAQKLAVSTKFVQREMV